MKIHVGNLSGEISEDDLRHVFEEIVKIVSIEIMNEKYKGITKIFAYIETDSEESGQSAIDKLNGKELKGSMLKVSKALVKTKGTGDKRKIPGLREGHGRGTSASGKGGFGSDRGGYSFKRGFGGKKGFGGGRGGRGR